MTTDMEVDRDDCGSSDGSDAPKPQSQHQQQQQNVFLVTASFRGHKVETAVSGFGEISVGQLKEQLLDNKNEEELSIHDIKLMHGGKVLDNLGADVYEILASKYKSSTNTKKRPKKVTFLATGLSAIERQKANEEIKEGIDHSTKLRLVRDDLSKEGQLELQRRKRLGKKMLNKAATRQNAMNGERSTYVFGRIETLPNLPDEDKARNILKMLAQDKGVLACMAKHKWTVGCLAELAPDGRVGQDPVCVMGLNQNHGQKILLRLRTDDLKGFRKILSIRKVLYHELAHNVHSEHDDKFFQLMRQIEKECTDPNIVGNGDVGRSLSGQEIHQSLDDDVDMEDDLHSFEGRTEKLGGGCSRPGSTQTTNVDDGIHTSTSPKEMAARAALLRLGVSDKTVNNNSRSTVKESNCDNTPPQCSCGRSHSSSKEQNENQCRDGNHQNCK